MKREKRKMKNVIRLIALMMVVVSCCSCSIIDNSTDKLVVNACIDSEPETIDPTMGYTNSVFSYTYHAFEGLMKYVLTANAVSDDKNMVNADVAPGQAASMPNISSDGLVYTFTLRDDAKWSDGVSVKAEDFVYSWQRLVDPKTGSDYGYILDGVLKNATAILIGEKGASELGIKAINDKTLEITLEKPCAYFLSLCAFAPLMPLRNDVIEEYGDKWTEIDNIVVNGPYKYAEWVHGSFIKMCLNENYYNKEKMGPDEILWWLCDDEEQILRSYQEGKYDFINVCSADLVDSLTKSGEYFTNPGASTYYLYFNTQVISDWRVRAALTISVDRENIIKNVTKNGEHVATNLVPNGITDSDGNYFSNETSGPIYETLSKLYPDFNLSTYEGKCLLSKKLVEEAVSDGFDINEKIEFKLNENETNRNIAEACAENWKNVLGLNIEITNQDWTDYSVSLDEKNFGIARYGWIADFNDALTFLELFTEDSYNNFSSWKNSNFESLIENAKKTAYGKERDEILYDACDVLFGEGGFPCCPIFFYANNYCMKGVSNVGYISTGCYFFMYAEK